MKSGTEYARKVKRLLTRLKRKYGAVQKTEPVDPVHQLLFGILHRGTTAARAEKALAGIRSAMVDLNELRVSTPSELIELMGSAFPYAKEKARAIVKALNEIFERYHDISLDALNNKGKREARRYLEGLEGVDSATAAGVMLFSLDGHAMPVDENMLRVLRKDELVHSDASVEEVQAFLERNVSASQGYVCTTLLRKYSEERARSLASLRSPARTAGGRTRPAKKKTSTTKKRASASKKRTGRAAKRAKKKTSRAASRASRGSPRPRKASSKKRTSPSASRKKRGAARKGKTKRRPRARSR
jgi:endonuclease III